MDDLAKLARLDGDALDLLHVAYLWTTTTTFDGPSGVRGVIAIDGKTVRGARSRDALVGGAVAAGVLPARAATYAVLLPVGLLVAALGTAAVLRQAW